MRLYELESDFDLTKKSKNKLFPSGPTFTWDPAKKQWLNPDGTQVARDIHFDLMKAVGLDPQGNKLKPGMIDKIKGAWAKSGAGIDPKASVLGKVMGRVGGAIGNAIGKAVAPKAAGADQSDAAPDANGDGKPDAPAAKAPQGAPQGAVQVDQDLGTIVKQMRSFKPDPQAKQLPSQMAQGVMKDLANVRNNKDWAVMTGSKILKFANAGYNVTALQKKWAQEYAIGSKQKIMQDQFSEELEELKKLAGI
jgi:hypothetical protein